MSYLQSVLSLSREGVGGGGEEEGEIRAEGVHFLMSTVP